MADGAALGPDLDRVTNRFDTDAVNGKLAGVFRTLHICDRKMWVALIHELPFWYGLKV